MTEKLGVLLVDVPEPKTGSTVISNLIITKIILASNALIQKAWYLHMLTNAHKKKLKNTHSFGG
jgi:hypothetical protein